MKFEVNKTEKTITLLDEINFDELMELQKFMGDDYASWKIKGSEKVTVIERDKYITIYPQTIPYPSYPIFPNPTTSPFWMGTHINTPACADGGHNNIVFEMTTLKDFPLNFPQLTTSTVSNQKGKNALA